MARLTELLVAVLCASAGNVMPVAGQPAGGMTPLPGRAGMAAIPAGTFRPLYDDGNGVVRVQAFRIDRYPVTRAQLAAFRRQPAVTGAEASRPATGVTQREAVAYCAARGARLPSEMEWEYVAAASETRRDGRTDAAFRQRLLDMAAHRPAGGPGRIGSTFRNAYGVYDMHGLVWEWVAPAHHDHAGGHHDMSCAGSARGATDTSDFAAFMRLAFRAGLTPDMRQPNLGFRCAS